MDGLLTQRQAAAYLGVSVSYLRASNCRQVKLPGNGPKGKALVRYRKADLDAHFKVVPEPQQKAG